LLLIQDNPGLAYTVHTASATCLVLSWRKGRRKHCLGWVGAQLRNKYYVLL